MQVKSNHELVEAEAAFYDMKKTLTNKMSLKVRSDESGDIP